MAKAVFLDRDGILNRLVYNPKTGENESPHEPEDFVMFPNLEQSLKALQKNDFLLFLVSNQPSYAKGKTSLENLKTIHKKLRTGLGSMGVDFKEYFYCYHHPDGVVKEYGGVCTCRKPSPFFLLQAKDRYGLDMKQSWMVGDDDRDVQCGQGAGVRTVLVDYELSSKRRGKSKPDFIAQDLDSAVKFILGVSK